MGNGSKRESPGLGSVFYTNAIPKLIKLDLRQSQVNTFCFSGKRIQSIAPPSFVVVQYLIKSLSHCSLSAEILRVVIINPLRVCGQFISLLSVITLLTHFLKVYV